MLVAGAGNALRADDGFGPTVIAALRARGVPLPGVRLGEVGAGGVGLVRELLEGFDTLVLVGTVDRGAAPGTLWVVDPVAARTGPPGHRWRAEDLGQVVPERVLALARSLGALPEFVRLVACQPFDGNSFSPALTPAVRRAVPGAMAAIVAIVRERLFELARGA